jgi:chromosome segregation ATPase
VNAGDVLVAIAQVAAGGTLAQGVMAFVRRRSELRQLDRETDSVAVDTADKLLTMLRTELESAKAESADLRRQVNLLGDEVARLRADLVVARAEINRIRGDIS